MTITKGQTKRRRLFSFLSKHVDKRENYSPYNVENKMTTVPSENPICPPRKLTEILVQQARDIQMLPAVAVKAIAIADDPAARVSDLVNVVAQDIKLTTDIVSLSNSSLFGSTKSVLSLQQAITRVGFRQTKNMIFASSITSMMQKMEWREIKIRDLLCKHSFLTGVINSRLNGLFSLGLQGEEFTAGLVHDIGRTLLAVSVPDEFPKFDPLDFNESQAQLDLEIDSIGTTHAEVGAWFLQRNHMPEELVSVARYHHVPQDAPKYKRLIAVTAIADEMSNLCEREGSEGVFDCREHPQLHLLESLGVDQPFEKLTEFSKVVLESAMLEVKQLVK